MAELEVWGDDPKLVELLGEQGEAGFRALFDGFPDVGRRPLGAPGRRGEGRRLHVRLRQPVDPARLPAAGLDARPLHAAGGAAADAREPRVRRLRRGLRVRRAVGPGGHLRHAVRRRLHARDVRPAHGQARRRADQLPHRRHRAAAHGGRAAQLRRRRRARPERADRRHHVPRRAARAPRRGAASRRRAAPAPDERRARPRPDRRRAALRAGGGAGDRAGRARAAHGRGRRGPAPAPGAGRRDGRGRRAARGRRRPAPAAPRAAEPDRATR